MPPHQTIFAKLPLRIQHGTPLHEEHDAVVKMLTNERETRRQSLKRSPHTFLGDSVQQEIIP